MEAEESKQTVKREKRPHLTKVQRFPKAFKETVRILKEVKSKQKSVKTALYSSKFRGQAFKKVYGLTYNIVKHLQLIDKVIDKVGLLQKEPYLTLESAEVMIHEIIIKGNTLPGENKPVLTMLKYKDEIGAAFSKCEQENPIEDIPSIPRYVRIHTLVTSVSKVIEWLINVGYKQVVLDPDMSLASFIEAVKKLAPGEFLQDFHFNDIFVFAPGENLSQTALYRKGHIFLQDKASYIPVHVLAPGLQSQVLDCCAAPGMKTIHLSCVMQNSGKIIAMDRDAKRFATLELAVKHAHATNCELSCMDFSKVDPTVEPYSAVEYILLDPSCSGSGIVSRLDACTDDKFSKNDDRIRKLSGFQIVLLKHALKFPNVKRIVYSTCSMTEEENEFVISEALYNHSRTFKVGNAFPEWETRGSENYSFGHLCVRAYPKTNLTNGFFVAVIERISWSNIDSINTANNSSNRLQTNGDSSNVTNSSDRSLKSECASKEEVIEDLMEPKRKKRKHDCEDVASILIENETNQKMEKSNEKQGKKHKKKKKNKSALHEMESREVAESSKVDGEHSNNEIYLDDIKQKSIRKRTDSVCQNGKLVLNNEEQIHLESNVAQLSILNAETNEFSEKTSKKKKKHKNSISDNSEFQNENIEIVNELSNKKKKQKRSKSENADYQLDNVEEFKVEKEDHSGLLEIESSDHSYTTKKKHKKSKLKDVENVEFSKMLKVESSEHLDMSYASKRKHKKSKTKDLQPENENVESLDKSCKKHKKTKSESAENENIETSVNEPPNTESNEKCQKQKKHKRKKME